MTRIRATCPLCGEVDLTPDDLTLTIVRGDRGNVTGESSYRFACPDCAEIVVKPADARIARLLETGGVAVETRVLTNVDVAETPPLPPHPERAAGGPPLSYDDVLDLHLLLASDDWFDRLRAV